MVIDALYPAQHCCQKFAVMDNRMGLIWLQRGSLFFCNYISDVVKGLFRIEEWEWKSRGVSSHDLARLRRLSIAVRRNLWGNRNTMCSF